MLHERDRAASVLVEELTMLGPQWHPLRSTRNPSATVSLYECSRFPRMWPPDISQKYITLVLFVFVDGGGGGSEICPALLETAVLRVPTRFVQCLLM